MGELNISNIMKLSEELGISMNEKEANKMIKMINMDGGGSQMQHIEMEAFIKALKISILELRAM